MKTFYLVMYVIAALLFAVAIFAPNPAATAGGRPRTFSLIAAGLFFWVAVDVCRQFDLLTD